MPRKLPTAYVRKLNEEQKVASVATAKSEEKKNTQPRDPASGRLKSFAMVCQVCGAQAKFTVDNHGYATCNNCGGIANYKFGHVA